MIDGEQRSASEFWERYFAFYDTLNQAIPYREMIEGHARMLDPRPGDHILDAGTGTGNVAVELIAAGARVTGVDFCEPALVRCRAKAPDADFRFADLTRPLPFPDASFDKVACCCVLHVLDAESQRRAVREFQRVVKPGGLVALTAFNTGFRPLTVYAETLRRAREGRTVPQTARFAVRHSINTVRILYYVSRIQRRERAGKHTFLSVDAMRQLLADAGLRTRSTEIVFAGQCVSAVAVKQGEAKS